ncbi:MAG: hypothetical protein PHF03_07600 [Syntrophomonadaceae bacterium]|nr:hypothetical protein [Syntrophomonadaceae bacterium]
MLFCMGMMVAYAIGVPNIGSLYRARYGFLMTLVALGMAGFFSLLKIRGASRYNSCPDEIVGGSVIDED